MKIPKSKQKPAGLKVPRGHIWCPLCMSTHEKDAYTVGWWVDDDKKVHKVTGHQEIHDMLADEEPPFIIHWSMESLDASLGSAPPKEETGVIDDGGR